MRHLLVQGVLGALHGHLEGRLRGVAHHDQPHDRIEHAWQLVDHLPALALHAQPDAQAAAGQQHRQHTQRADPAGERQGGADGHQCHQQPGHRGRGWQCAQHAGRHVPCRACSGYGLRWRLWSQRRAKAQARHGQRRRAGGRHVLGRQAFGQVPLRGLVPLAPLRELPGQNARGEQQQRPAQSDESEVRHAGLRAMPGAAVAGASGRSWASAGRCPSPPSGPALLHGPTPPARGGTAPAWRPRCRSGR